MNFAERKAQLLERRIKRLSEKLAEAIQAGDVQKWSEHAQNIRRYQQALHKLNSAE